MPVGISCTRSRKLCCWRRSTAPWARRRVAAVAAGATCQALKHSHWLRRPRARSAPPPPPVPRLPPRQRFLRSRRCLARRRREARNDAGSSLGAEAPNARARGAICSSSAFSVCAPSASSGCASALCWDHGDTRANRLAASAVADENKRDIDPVAPSSSEVRPGGSALLAGGRTVCASRLVLSGAASATPTSFSDCPDSEDACGAP